MAVDAIPKGANTVTPYLIVNDARKLIQFMKRAFHAEERGVHEDANGRVMHAEMRIRESNIMIGEANPEWPARLGMVHLYVPDVDAVFQRALDAGGKEVREPRDEFYGDRSGGVEDPCGVLWWIATHVEDVSPEEMQRRQETMAANG